MNILGGCENNRIFILLIIIILLICIFYYCWNKKENLDRNYIGYPLDSSRYIPDSGADLRFASQFTETDQGN